MIASLRSKPGSKLYYGRPLEGSDDWIDRAYIDANDHLYLPAHAVKKALDSSLTFAAKHGMVEESLHPGRSLNEWLVETRANFKTGILVVEPPKLTTTTGSMPLRRSDLVPVWHHVPRYGRGDNEKVAKGFPTVESWAMSVTMCLLSDAIDESLVELSLMRAGSYIGFGAMRIENGGCNGAFELVAFGSPVVPKSTAEAR
jgi:hypothetical protein